MKLHRLGLLIGASTLVFAGTYACSSDDDNNTSNTNDAGHDATTDTGTPILNNPDSGNGDDTPDANTGTPDTGTDAGSVDLSDCVGNPLSVDGGTPDASIASTAATVVGTGNFLYGPLWIDAFGGQLVYSESNFERIDRTDGKGGASVVVSTTDSVTDVPAQNALSNGTIYTALTQNDGSHGSIMKTPADAGADASTFSLLPDVNGSVVTISGIAVHAKGILYFTDPQFNNSGVPTTGVYSMPVGGGAVTAVTTFDQNTAADRPVGIAFNRDQSSLFVSHYVFAPATETGHITKYAVDANGVASNPTDLPFVPAGRPLGIAIDSGGNIWIAEENANANAGLVEVIDATGTTRWATLPIPTAHANGIAFGGTDRKTVYITTDSTTGGNGDKLYSLPTRCQGF